MLKDVKWQNWWYQNLIYNKAFHVKIIKTCYMLISCKRQGILILERIWLDKNVYSMSHQFLFVWKKKIRVFKTYVSAKHLGALKATIFSTFNFIGSFISSR